MTPHIDLRSVLRDGIAGDRMICRSFDLRLSLSQLIASKSIIFMVQRTNEQNMLQADIIQRFPCRPAMHVIRLLCAQSYNHGKVTTAEI